MIRGRREARTTCHPERERGTWRKGGTQELHFAPLPPPRSLVTLGMTREPPSRLRAWFQQRKPDHLVQQAGPDVGIPLRLPRRDLAEVESDDPFSGPTDGAKQADRLVPGEAARHGRAG